MKGEGERKRKITRDRDRGEEKKEWVSTKCNADKGYIF
jgi:hypothetical protein